ncbi:hypothetical protein V6Z11_A13G058300 [Gossypium hirsutum]|uniref:Uncharacterized protein n=1 Tax=Gossypium hirsutum TaxID=3635 RepID=A0A1U8M2U8_GOSHI|nr:uncharacterized protein LOC107932398 [Gossypium hirsutum]
MRRDFGLVFGKCLTDFISVRHFPTLTWFFPPPSYRRHLPSPSSSNFVLLKKDVRKQKLELRSLRNSKGEKDWTRRTGNDFHLICIEDPFVVSHDLNRVVDKFSIKVLREEFERATNVVQYDPNL